MFLDAAYNDVVGACACVLGDDDSDGDDEDAQIRRARVAPALTDDDVAKLTGTEEPTDLRDDESAAKGSKGAKRAKRADGASSSSSSSSGGGGEGESNFKKDASSSAGKKSATGLPGADSGSGSDTELDEPLTMKGSAPAARTTGGNTKPKPEPANPATPGAEENKELLDAATQQPEGEHGNNTNTARRFAVKNEATGKWGIVLAEPGKVLPAYNVKNQAAADSLAAASMLTKSGKDSKSVPLDNSSSESSASYSPVPARARSSRRVKDQVTDAANEKIEQAKDKAKQAGKAKAGKAGKAKAPRKQKKAVSIEVSDSDDDEDEEVDGASDTADDSDYSTTTKSRRAKATKSKAKAKASGGSGKAAANTRPSAGGRKMAGRGTTDKSNALRMVKTTEHEGVFWDINCQLWRASIDIRGKTKFLGVFTTDAEAADKRREEQQKEDEKDASNAAKKVKSAQRKTQPPKPVKRRFQTTGHLPLDTETSFPNKPDECMVLLRAARFSVDEIVRIVQSNKGSKDMLGAAKVLSELKARGFDNGGLAKILGSEGGAKTTIALHKDYKKMSETFANEHLVTISAVSNGSQNLTKNVRHLSKQLLRDYDVLRVEDVTRCLAFEDGAEKLEAMLQNIEELLDLDFSVKQMITMVEKEDGPQNLENAQEHLDKIKALGFTANQAVRVVTHIGGPRTLKKIQEELVVLKSEAFKTDQSVRMVTHRYGSQALFKARAKLKQAEKLGFTQKQVFTMLRGSRLQDNEEKVELQMQQAEALLEILVDVNLKAENVAIMGGIDEEDIADAQKEFKTIEKLGLDLEQVVLLVANASGGDRRSLRSIKFNYTQMSTMIQMIESGEHHQSPTVKLQKLGFSAAQIKVFLGMKPSHEDLTSLPVQIHKLQHRSRFSKSCQIAI